jgi:hypothetical protein
LRHRGEFLMCIQPQRVQDDPEAKYCPHGLDTRLECRKCIDAAVVPSQEKP